MDSCSECFSNSFLGQNFTFHLWSFNYCLDNFLYICPRNRRNFCCRPLVSVSPDFRIYTRLFIFRRNIKPRSNKRIFNNSSRINFYFPGLRRRKRKNKTQTSPLHDFCLHRDSRIGNYF